jgi:nitroimidazol reductase NimA-like FMN-containing flavoprotein (pyridoxamine 5'-phosphate oxidase superfamily)
MFRAMRRSGQQLPWEEALEILKNGETGVLAVLGDEGYPYAVPLNYALVEDCLYFHCARDGHKTDAVRKNAKVSFCVVEKDTVVPPIFATDYRSAIVFGRARMVEEDALKRKALLALVEKYGPAHREEGVREMETEWDRVTIVEIRIEHLTGKEASKRVKSFCKQEG